MGPKVNTTWFKTIPTDRRRTSWLFTSVAEELDSGLPRHNSSLLSERDLNPGTPDFNFSALTTRLRCLLHFNFKSVQLANFKMAFYCLVYLSLHLPPDMRIPLILAVATALNFQLHLRSVWSQGWLLYFPVISLSKKVYSTLSLFVSMGASEP